MERALSTMDTTSTKVDAASASMRAVVQSRYGSSEVLRLASATRPKPNEGEVVVRVHAAGIDRGTWHLMTGRPYLMRIMGFGFFGPKNPVAGLDLAGTVVEIGPNVTRFKVGDEVFGIGAGSFAEYARAREDKLARLPKGLSFERAAVLGVSGSTALQALVDHGKLERGERVLVVGASGGVGTYAVQIAKALGAHVTGVCSTEKVELVRRLGADHVIDYKTNDFTESTTRFDLVIDIGGNTPVSRLRGVMTEAGRLVFVGNEQGGDWTAGFGRPLYGAMLGLFAKQRFLMLAAKEHASFLERLTVFLDAGQIAPEIERTISLADVPNAISDLEAGRVRGKLAVRIA